MLAVVALEWGARATFERELVFDGDALADVAKRRKGEVRPDALHHEADEVELALVLDLGLEVPGIFEELVEVRVDDEVAFRERPEPSVHRVSLHVRAVDRDHADPRRPLVDVDVEGPEEGRRHERVHRLLRRPVPVQQDGDSTHIDAEAFVVPREEGHHRRRRHRRRHHHPQRHAVPQKPQRAAAGHHLVIRPQRLPVLMMGRAFVRRPAAHDDQCQHHQETRGSSATRRAPSSTSFCRSAANHLHFLV
mmetsp:Transcript_14528/g.47344  ORF Transcript_14528/g.47344 Transcript_14528/m.47344 type:complete len:249 (-) Transcript_14528:9-755(-)